MKVLRPKKILVISVRSLEFGAKARTSAGSSQPRFMQIRLDWRTVYSYIRSRSSVGRERSVGFGGCWVSIVGDWIWELVRVGY